MNGAFIQEHYFFTLQALAKLYLDAASLVWNGNHVTGNEAIQKYYEALPSSTHNVESFDSQPIPGILSAIILFLIGFFWILEILR